MAHSLITIIMQHHLFLLGSRTLIHKAIVKVPATFANLSDVSLRIKIRLFEGSSLVEESDTAIPSDLITWVARRPIKDLKLGLATIARQLGVELHGRDDVILDQGTRLSTF